MKPLTRRRFLRLSAAAGLSALAAGGGGFYSYRIEPGRLAVESIEIHLPGLAHEMDGLRLVQISDIHAGRDLPPEQLETTARQIEALAPDLLVVTGDWVTYDAHDAQAAARTVASYSPPLGIYAILGNHDYWTDAEIVADAVQAAGITLLRNQNVAILAGEPALYLAGVDDIWENQDDLSQALEGIPANAPVILLAHEPDYADEVAADGRVALQLSGHSHGGQVNVPLFGTPVTPHLGKKYPRGYYQVGDSLQLYTNRGIGLVRPAVRLNCRPEITHITLRG